VALLLAYAPETMGLLPALLREARTGDPGPLAAQALIAAGEVGAGMTRALQLAVLCAEDVPFFEEPGGDPPLLLRRFVRDAFRGACARWPAVPVPAAFREPVRSEAPTLLLSGEADPVTPPRWAERAARTLPRSRHLVVPGAAHGTLARGCVPRLVAEFLSRGSAEGLDAACLERHRPPPFFLDLAGPPP
jgi:pimeloyl-ACP methyl ester carboxylesterase